MVSFAIIIQPFAFDDGVHLDEERVRLRRPAVRATTTTLFVVPTWLGELDLER